MSMRVLGLMSGTSLDGVDAAIIDTDGERVLGFGPARTFAYAPDDRCALMAAVEDALSGASAPASFEAAARVIERKHADAVHALLAEPDAGEVELIGFHGQTVIHRPEAGLTRQLGSGEVLAAMTGIDVVWDLRAADVAAGGQGAPIVPVYHKALAARAGLAAPVAVLNIGGVANVTFIGRGGELIAFDTGPGNGLIDQLMETRGAGAFDEGGRIAASGAVDELALRRLLDHPYFEKGGTKSLDRYDFSLAPVAHLALADAAATLVAFTAATVALGASRLPQAPQRWIICGGGRHNAAIMAALEARLGVPCLEAEAVGWRGDTVEAEAIAYLAARSVMGLPLTFEGTTGVPRPMTGGRRAAA